MSAPLPAERPGLRLQGTPAPTFCRQWHLQVLERQQAFKARLLGLPGGMRSLNLGVGQVALASRGALGWFMGVSSCMHTEGRALSSLKASGSRGRQSGSSHMQPCRMQAAPCLGWGICKSAGLALSRKAAPVSKNPNNNKRYLRDERPHGPTHVA